MFKVNSQALQLESLLLETEHKIQGRTIEKESKIRSL